MDGVATVEDVCIVEGELAIPIPSSGGRAYREEGVRGDPNIEAAVVVATKEDEGAGEERAWVSASFSWD